MYALARAGAALSSAPGSAVGEGAQPLPHAPASASQVVLRGGGAADASAVSGAAWLAFDESGWLLAACIGNEVVVVESGSGAAYARLQGHVAAVTCCAWSSGSTHVLFSVRPACELPRTAARGGSLVGALRHTNRRPPLPTAALMRRAKVSEDRTVKAWDLARRQLLWQSAVLCAAPLLRVACCGGFGGRLDGAMGY